MAKAEDNLDYTLLIRIIIEQAASAGYVIYIKWDGGIEFKRAIEFEEVRGR